MGRQTTVQDSNTIRFGSAKIEIGATIGTLVDVGAANNVVFNESWDNVKVMSANAGEIVIGMRNQMALVTFDMLEANMTKLNVLRGGIDTYSTTAAAPVNVTAEEVTLNAVTATRLAKKNGDGTIVSTIVVKDGTLVTTYTVNTDYSVGVDSSGFTVITRIAGAGISDGQTVKVDYEYTPNASKTLSSGGKFTIAPRVLRLTNTNEAGNDFVMTFKRVKTTQGIQFTLNPDDAVDPNFVGVQLEATRDETLAAGSQLFEIVDEQAV